MQMYGNYVSPLGYQNGDNGIDSYGVNHNGFSLRDELAYQAARQQREKQLMQNYNAQGITENYPQYSNNFWGDATNNYGFGMTNIENNITNVLNPLNNNLNQGVQYAQNTLPNIVNDVNQTSKMIDYSLYGNDFSKEFIDNMLGDTRFQRAMQRTKFNEGGFANHPNDRGGITNYGISSKYYHKEDIINITPQRAQAILYRDYWLKPSINQLPDEFADIVFDDGVVQGQPTAIINLQKALGVKPDGLIGSQTLNAFQNKNYDTIKANFIRNVHSVEDKYLQKDPSQKVFEQGHRNRFNQY
jgi:hypothetical protein